MKKRITLLFLVLSIVIKAQEVKKATSNFNFKIGLIGTWVAYEHALNKNLTINSEIGYVGAILKGTNGNRLDYIFKPMYNVEPRYYYNFDKRIDKGKKTNNNAANYLGLSFIYSSGNELTNTSIQARESFVILPRWGFNRNLSPSINFEFAIGTGYGCAKDIQGGIIGLDLKFSYFL